MDRKEISFVHTKAVKDLWNGNSRFQSDDDEKEERKFILQESVKQDQKE